MYISSYSSLSPHFKGCCCDSNILARERWSRLVIFPPAFFKTNFSFKKSRATYIFIVQLGTLCWLDDSNFVKAERKWKHETIKFHCVYLLGKSCSLPWKLSRIPAHQPGVKGMAFGFCTHSPPWWPKNDWFKVTKQRGLVFVLCRYV